ncbi:hypothetical protein MAR_037064 [Mya arenaria]|uniref:Uncharacterized protein n=1 Tax=Mya arenaria TaxID=6604 RepID=A0ABY7FMF2_MYAAR|nr:hypothetical protein MAR_037064 [Mya arenaria]
MSFIGCFKRTKMKVRKIGDFHGDLVLSHDNIHISIRCTLYIDWILIIPVEAGYRLCNQHY